MSKSFLYRDHRGTLEDSMSTVQEFESKDQLIDYLKRKMSIFKVTDFSGLKIEFYCHDERIEWDCYIVFMDGHGAFGFTNKLPE